MDNKKLFNLFGNKTEEVVSAMLHAYQAFMDHDYEQAEEAFSLFVKICSYKHIFGVWCGHGDPCQPDKWIFMVCGREYTTQVDSVSYDGVNAYCTYIGRH